jgi:hypothetical protein
VVVPDWHYNWVNDFGLIVRRTIGFFEETFDGRRVGSWTTAP